MIKKYIKNNKTELKQCIEDLKHKDRFYKQIPNLLTFLRLIGGIPAGILFYLGLPYLSITLIAFLWITDAVDGRVARKYHLQSKIGADMDAFADKIMCLSSSIPLLASLPGLIINLVLEAIISLINVLGRVKGLETKTVLSGKVKTVSLAGTLILGYLHQFLNLPMIIFSLMNSITVIAQSIAIKDYIIKFNKMNKEKSKNVNTLEKCIDLSEKENLTDKYTKNHIDELRTEKEFLLSIKEEKLIDKPKTRIRKKNNNHN